MLADRNNFAWMFIAGFFLLIWLIIFIFNKPLRKPLLIISLIFSLTGIIGEFFTNPDYWNPNYLLGFSIKTPHKFWHFGIEDMVATFAYSGVSFWLYELFSKNKSMGKFRFGWRPVITIFIWGFLCFSAMFLLYLHLGVNGINSSLLVTLLFCIVIYGFYHANLKPGLITALIVGFFYFFFLVIIFKPLFPDSLDIIWNKEGNSGIALFKVPVEEFAWAFLNTLFIGPVYRILFLSSKQPDSHLEKTAG